METTGKVNFKDDEYVMEEALQRIRLQLISMLEEDECLQCLQASHCCCSDPYQHQGYQVYQLFDHGIYGHVFQVPPPASQVPKPYWIHGNWAPSQHLEQSWMKIKNEKQNRSWEIAKASTDLILTAKKVAEEAKKSYRCKIFDWFDASERPKRNVARNAKEYKKDSTELTPVWPPTTQSPWYQRTNKTKYSKRESNSVEAFFQKFAREKQVTVVPKQPQLMQATFFSVPYHIVAGRMNIACSGILANGYGVTSMGMKMNCAM